MKEYIKLLSLHRFKPTLFIDNAIKTKWTSILFHFIFVMLIIYLPIFVLIVKTQPYELFPRAYGLNIIDRKDSDEIPNFNKLGIIIHEEDGYITYIETENNDPIKTFIGNSTIIFSENSDKNLENLSTPNQNNFYVLGNVIAYSSDNNYLTTSINNIRKETLETMDLKEIFNIITISNNYFSEFLLPVSLILFLIVIALQLIYIPTIVFLMGYSRLKYKNFTFIERLKVIIFSLTIPAIASCIIGCFLPIIHLFLFQAISVFVVILLYKKYDNNIPENPYL